MAKCVICDKECDNFYVVWSRPWEQITDTEWHSATYCSTCINNKIAEHNIVYYKWDYYYRDHPEVTRCDRCWNPVHVKIYNTTGWWCNKCMLERTRAYPNMSYCEACWTYHLDWMCNGWLDDMRITSDKWLRFTVRKDSKSRDPKGWENWNQAYIKSIWQFQTERELDSKTRDMLKNFYHNTRSFPHYYTREPVNITGTVKYNNTRVLSDIKHILSDLRDFRERYIRNCKRVSKYSNYYLRWLTDDWLIRRGYIDVMWNVRERCESINKFYQDIWEEVNNAQMTWEFKYILSSDLHHKIEAFKLNDKVSSCQKSHNYDSYARGAYDAITNGCNCPILLYNQGNTEPFARITTRIMYDKQGQEYILIDRIYHSWEFSDAAMKWAIYKWIVEDLKRKWYKVIVSNYSAHDESTYAYLASLGMNSNTIIEDLCQPLRRLIGWYGYYCDWWTVVRTWEIDDVKRATDYLDKAYLL